MKIEIPEHMISDYEYRKSTIQLYAFLKQHGVVKLTNKQLCHHTKLSILSIHNAIHKLKSDGYLVIEKYRGLNDKNQSVNKRNLILLDHRKQ